MFHCHFKKSNPHLPVFKGDYSELCIHDSLLWKFSQVTFAQQRTLLRITRERGQFKVSRTVPRCEPEAPVVMQDEATGKLSEG